MVNLRLPDGRVLAVKEGSTLGEVSRSFKSAYASPIVEGIFNGVGIDLQKPLTEDGSVDFIELYSEEGQRVYIRSLLFLLIVAVYKLYPSIKMQVRNTLGSALYIKICKGEQLDAAKLEAVTAVMRQMIGAKEPILYKRIPLAEALKASQLNDTLEDRMGLFAMFPKMKYFSANILDGVEEYFFGPLLSNVELLEQFSLLPFEEGLVVTYPSLRAGFKLQPWNRCQRINEIYHEAEEWSAMIGCNTVSKLNGFINQGKAEKIIRVAEALQEKKIAATADFITKKNQDVKLILIAGPSSSGKTSFAQRLSVQLEVNGIKPIPISLDNYYLNRLDTPRKADGSYDFECLEAIDLKLFNEHLEALTKGKSVKVPKYNFRAGVREYRGEEVQMTDNSVFVVEGIHGLNEKLTAAIPAAKKLKIYVSALTPMSLDAFNRIQTTDMRLLRRMVRDSQFRSHDAAMTLAQWPDVREGEEKYIFPYQEEADIFFNTSLIYEPAVLRKYAEPLLKAITRQEKVYSNAQRLLGLLSLIMPLDEAAIPNNSILREFLGGSVFKDAL